MNNPDYIYESLETILLVKIIKFFDADPGWKKVGSGIRSWHAVRMCFPLLNTGVHHHHSVIVTRNQCCGSGSGMNNPDHIYESLETILGYNT
jgi:hypothetical protein